MWSLVRTAGLEKVEIHNRTAQSHTPHQVTKSLHLSRTCSRPQNYSASGLNSHLRLFECKTQVFKHHTVMITTQNLLTLEIKQAVPGIFMAYPRPTRIDHPLWQTPSHIGTSSCLNSLDSIINTWCFPVFSHYKFSSMKTGALCVIFISRLPAQRTVRDIRWYSKNIC